MTSTLTHQKSSAPFAPVNQRKLVTESPGPERILTAYRDAKNTADLAVSKALLCGQLLLEQRNLIIGVTSRDRTKPDDQKFGVWLKQNAPEIPTSTAYRWMELATRVAESLHAPQYLKIGEDQILLSSVIGSRADDLPEQAATLRQTFFDFLDGKTMKECLAGVVVEGDEPHRITRAHNGKNAKGAGGGGDRKAYATFTAVKLKHLTTFFNASMPQAEQGKIAAAFESSLERWPKWILQTIAAKAGKEFKMDEGERAMRNPQ